MKEFSDPCMCLTFLEIEMLLNSFLFRFASHVLSVGSCIGVSRKVGHQIRRQNWMDKGISFACVFLFDSLCFKLQCHDFAFLSGFLWPFLPLGHFENSDHQTFTRKLVDHCVAVIYLGERGRWIESHISKEDLFSALKVKK